MKKVMCLFAVACVFLLTTSCASIVSTSNWPVQIGSTPEGADVTITDLKAGKKIFTGKTPTTVTLSSKEGYFSGKNYKLDMSMEGYTPQGVEITSNLNGWYWGNIIFGGLIGLFIVDPLTGAMWRLNPRDVNLVLQQKTASIPNDQNSLTVLSIDDVPEHLRGKLVRIK
jgi:hypothetical protein